MHYKKMTKRITRTQKIQVAILIALIVIPLFLYLFVKGDIKLAAWTVRCGHQPIIGQDNLYKQKEYYVPGHVFYNASPLKLFASSPAFFCSEAEAVHAGYTKKPTSSEIKQRAIEREKMYKAIQLQRAQSANFDIYTFDYVPWSGKKKPGFKYQLIKAKITSDPDMVQAIEYSPNPLWVEQTRADGALPGYECYRKDPCLPYARDKAGRVIVSTQEERRSNYYYGLTRGNTVIRITTRKPLPPDEVVKVVNSLRLATEAERQTVRED